MQNLKKQITLKKIILVQLKGINNDLDDETKKKNKTSI